jgi:hypothetical protein
MNERPPECSDLTKKRKDIQRMFGFHFAEARNSFRSGKLFGRQKIKEGTQMMQLDEKVEKSAK